MVDQSAAADLRANQDAIDMLKEVEEKAGTATPGSAELTGPAGMDRTRPRGRRALRRALRRQNRG